jgi:hypothetical protein
MKILILSILFIISTPSKVIDRATPWDSSGNGEVYYLDRHEVKCLYNEVLSNFKLERNGDNIRFVFSCIQSQAVIFPNNFHFSRSEKKSLSNPFSAEALDGLLVDCKRKNWAVQKFKFVRENNLIYIDFECKNVIKVDLSKTRSNGNAVISHEKSYLAFAGLMAGDAQDEYLSAIRRFSFDAYTSVSISYETYTLKNIY